MTKLLQLISKPILLIGTYAWTIPLAIKLSIKLYKYRKDGYDKNEIKDLIITFLSGIGIQPEKKKEGTNGKIT
jgi:hypothetical protein